MILTWLLLRPRRLLPARAFSCHRRYSGQQHGHHLNAGRLADDRNSPTGPRHRPVMRALRVSVRVEFDLIFPSPGDSCLPDANQRHSRLAGTTRAEPTVTTSFLASGRSRILFITIARPGCVPGLDRRRPGERWGTGALPSGRRGFRVPQRGSPHPRTMVTLAGPRFWHQPLLDERCEATTLVGFHRDSYILCRFLILG
jgi:hypothetical protein